MRLTTKDKVALPVAILLGAAFGYFSMLAGYGGLLIGGFYGIVVVPLVVLFVAGQKKILVWQACIVPSALWVDVENARLGLLGIAGGFQVFFVFWTLETVISSPVPIFLYWKRSRERAGHQVAWFFLGLVFVGMICSLWRDPFLFCRFRSCLDCAVSGEICMGMAQGCRASRQSGGFCCPFGSRAGRLGCGTDRFFLQPTSVSCGDKSPPPSACSLACLYGSRSKCA
jgi:hypothetical protein